MKRKLYLIIAFFFIEGLIHNLGHPVTPALVRGMEIKDYMFGVFFAMMSLGMMIGAPLWGIIGDRGHKKISIIIGLLAYSIGQFFFAYSGNQYLMIFFRLFSGLGVAAPLTLLTSETIEISVKSLRAKHLAFAGAATTVGTAVGYFLGGFISTHPMMKQALGTDDLRIVFLIQTVLNGFYVLFIYLTFNEKKNEESMQKTATSIISQLKNITKIDFSQFLFFMSLFFITIGNTNLNKYIDVYFDGLGYTPQDLGTFVMVTGMISLLSSIFIVPIVAKAKKQLMFISIIQLMSAVIVFIVFRAEKFLLNIYTLYMIYIMIKTIYQPLEQNHIAQSANEGNYGSIMGLRQSFLSLGMFVGPLLGGLLYSMKPLWLFDLSSLTFIIGVVLLIVMMLIQKNRPS